MCYFSFPPIYVLIKFNSSSLIKMVANIHEIKEFVWIYVLPMLTLLGITTNLLNIVIFSRPRMRLISGTHVYLMTYSIVEFVYMVLCFIHYASHTKFLSFIHYRYGFVFYQLFFFNFMTTVLAYFMMFIKIAISIKQLSSISK